MLASLLSLIAKGLNCLNQTPTCQNWFVLLFQKLTGLTKFLWGRLGGIASTTFWPWGRSPPSPPWSRRLWSWANHPSPKESQQVWVLLSRSRNSKRHSYPGLTRRSVRTDSAKEPRNEISAVRLLQRSMVPTMPICCTFTFVRSLSLVFSFVRYTRTTGRGGCRLAVDVRTVRYGDILYGIVRMVNFYPIDPQCFSHYELTWNVASSGQEKWTTQISTT